jgi:5-methylthioribose kinase
MTGELDIERPGDLVEYLRHTHRIGPDETPRVRVLAGGVSNRTVLVERTGGEAWVLKQALAKLRVKVDWFSDPARIGREADALRILPGLAPPGTITPLVFEDPAGHLLAMAAVAFPHENFKTVLLSGRVCNEHIEQFARILGAIHRRGAERFAELKPLFSDRTFFQTLRLEPYYEYSAKQRPESQPFINALVADTLRRILTLVHGDYSPKNVLIHAGRLVLLDHEVIHLGDPGFDLGFAMTHLLSKANHLADHRAQFARATELFWTTYQEELGSPAWAADLETFAARHTLGCLLARVAGRSPLEYLDPVQREAQLDTVLELMKNPPRIIFELTANFIEGIGRHVSH